MVVVVLIGTFLDFLVHIISERFSVPEYYFSNKIIYATFWFLVGLIVFWRVHKPLSKAILMTALVAIVLQTRYFFEGYPLWFVFFFMVVHFVAFLLPVYIIFLRNKHLFGISR